MNTPEETARLFIEQMGMEAMPGVYEIERGNYIRSRSRALSIKIGFYCTE